MDHYQINTLSSYCFGKSIITPDKYAKRAKELGYRGIGIIDEELYSFPSFQMACDKEGLKAIFGIRISLKTVLNEKLSCSLIIKNEEGYSSLLLLKSLRREEYTTEDLILNKKGLILIIESQSSLLKDEETLSRISPQISLLRKNFQDDFYFGISISSIVENNEIVRLYEYCSNNDYKTIAFPLVRYLKKKDYSSLYVLNKALSKEKAEEIPQGGPDFLLSTNSLHEIYREEDIFNVVELVNKINFQFFIKRGKLISFNNASTKLSDLARKGLTSRLNTEIIPLEYSSRLDFELNTIDKMNFSSYFLLVQDYVNFAKKRGIYVGPGRGSACGSLVSFALGITDVDPIKHSLSFERFLNPMRKDMPDIDIDFQDDRREEVIDYLKSKYGSRHVSDILTFVKLKPKNAVSMIGGALSYAEPKLKAFSSAIPEGSSSFEEALKDSRKGKQLNDLLKDDYYLSLKDKIEPLLGIPINTSIHAAGIIIAEDELYKSVPLSKGTEGTAMFEYPYLEKLGFLKMDILSLSNLTMIARIEKDIGEKIDISEKMDDKKTFNLLNSLNLCKIFQLESKGMKNTILKVKPSSFSDITSIIALYRPGPMEYIDEFAKRKNGQKAITYSDPRLEEILKETYGICVYQEQVIEMLKKLASFSGAEADMFRRALSKKKAEQIESYKTKFISGCKNNGIDETNAVNIFHDIEKFSSYGFNKSHAVAYSYIAYKLLYLKANYTESFFKIALSDSSLASDDTYSLMKEMYEMGYSLSLPDINISEVNSFSIHEKKFVIPLSNITSLDRKLSEKIIEERQKKKFVSFYDFCFRMKDEISQSKETDIKRLIDAGAFDSICLAREQMKSSLEDYLAFARMFFDEKNIPPIKGDEDLGKRLIKEKESLGVILSRSIKKLERKAGYTTLLVTEENPSLDNSFFRATDGRKEYLVQYRISGLERYSFILVKGTTEQRTITPSDIIVLGRKKEEYS